MTIRKISTDPEFIPDTAWHEIGAVGEPAFTNSWANLGSSWTTAAFRITSDGWVHLKGLIASGSGAAFTLPVGYRPARGYFAPTICQTSAPAYVAVSTTGVVSPDILTGSNTYISLNGMRFPVHQDWEINGRMHLMNGIAQRISYSEIYPCVWTRDNGFNEVLGISDAASAGSMIPVPRDYINSHMCTLVDNSNLLKRFDVSSGIPIS